MTRQINMRPNATVNGGSSLGIMGASGNPWLVADALAAELVNRSLADYADTQGASPVALQGVPDGSPPSFLHPVYGAISLRARRTTPVRGATIGDSTANNGSIFDYTVATPFPASGATVLPLQSVEKLAVAFLYPRFHYVFNGGNSGDKTTDILARADGSKSIADVRRAKPDVILGRCGSINNLKTVTAATADATVNTAYTEHVKIINLATQDGALFVDEGIAGYGMAGSADNLSAQDHTDPVVTRACIVRLNAMFQAYAAANPSRVRFLNPVGITCNSDGYYLPGRTLDGKHASIAGAYMLGQAEAALLTALFGDGTIRFSGDNSITNASMISSSVQSYGTLATGYAINVTNATRQNAKIESIDGALWQTCEFTQTSGTGQGQIQMPYAPANYGISANDVWGAEFDFFIRAVNSATLPDISALLSVLDNYKTSAGRVVLNGLVASTVQATTLTEIRGHVSMGPWQITEPSANLTASSNMLLSFSTALAGASWKMGVSSPRMVKLNQPMTTI